MELQIRWEGGDRLLQICRCLEMEEGAPPSVNVLKSKKKHDTAALIYRFVDAGVVVADRGRLPDLGGVGAKEWGNERGGEHWGQRRRHAVAGAEGVVAGSEEWRERG